MTTLFPHVLLEAFQAAPDRVAFEHGSRKITRGEVLELIFKLASAMRALGLGPGRAVAVVVGVSVEAFAVHMAAHVVGACVVGIRNGYTPRQLSRVLGMGVDVLVVDPAEVTPELKDAARSLRWFSIGRYPEAVDLLACTAGGTSRDVTVRADDVAALHFTSGSTGDPKGCAVTYGALSQHFAWKGPRTWSPVAKELAAGFERYMLFGTLASLVVKEFLALCLLGGGTAVIPENDGRPIFPHAIARHRISGSIVTVPRLYRMLDILKDEVLDMSSLRALMVSGSPLSPNRLAAALERLGPVVYQGYGQNEAGSISMLTPADVARHPAAALSSVGRPHPEVEVSVRETFERPVVTGETGEVYVRSPYQMQHYYGQPDETSEVLREGWLKTRDLGYLDEHGFLHLVGRVREVAMINAMVVHLGPIEQVLASDAAVDQAYAVEAPDEQSGEAIHAFVVPSAGRSIDIPGLQALVRTALGDDSVPKTITVLERVPIAASGKPDKHALRALSRSNHLA
jgi:fatty-acyl-CoA synthase